METCFNYTDPQTAFFSSDERKWINKIHRIALERPDEVRIIREPETNDGCIYVSLPASWLKIAPKRILSEEEREEFSRRAKETFSAFRERSQNSTFSEQEGGSDGEDEYLSI